MNPVKKNNTLKRRIRESTSPSLCKTKIEITQQKNGNKIDRKKLEKNGASETYGTITNT